MSFIYFFVFNVVVDTSELTSAAVKELKIFIKGEINNLKRSILYDINHKMQEMLVSISGAHNPDTQRKPPAWKIIEVDLPFDNPETFLDFEETLRTDPTKQEALVSNLLATC